MMPVMDARNAAAATAAPRSDSGSFASAAAARRNPVPQMGPDVPPVRLVMMVATRRRNVASLSRSRSSQFCNTTSKPRARENPKSPSPDTESSSQK
jgi:hypothetical protein